MELTTIEMPKEEAAERMREYRKRLETEQTLQDQRIAAGYAVQAVWDLTALERAVLSR